MSLLEVLAWIALAGWLAVLLDRTRSWPTGAELPGSPSDGAGAWLGRVAVIVPARNEADLLPTTLPSLLGQTIDSLVVYVVDDGSTDATSAVARSVGERTGQGAKLRVLAAGPRPAGWTGKVHAQEKGYRQVLEEAAGLGLDPPEWILFTDADIEHRTDSLAALASCVKPAGGAEELDLVSVMVRLRAESFWERLIVPTFVFFFQLLYPFRRVARLDSRVAAAAGGCILLRRRTLEKAGGLRRIRSAVIDDVALATVVKRAGARLWLGFDSGIVSRRAYPRLRDLWSMVRRTAFTQLGHDPLLLVLTLTALAVFVVSPPGLIVGVLAGVGLGGGEWSLADTRTLIAAASAWLLMSLELYPAVKHHRVPGVFAMSLPLGGMLFGLMTLSSAWDHWTDQESRWRGRPDSER